MCWNSTFPLPSPMKISFTVITLARALLKKKIPPWLGERDPGLPSF